MIKLFKRFKYKDYKNQLKLSFPKILESDLNAVLNILPFDNNETQNSLGQSYSVDNLFHPSIWKIKLDNEVLTIPYRVYFNEPIIEDEKRLTEIQKLILNCIFLRHHNGYIRQKRLEQLNGKTEYWLVPHTLQLLGEYVFDILQELDKQINDKTIDNYRRFVNENPEYWVLTQNRMISYWNIYYRRDWPKLKEYLGYQIADKIKKANT